MKLNWAIIKYNFYLYKIYYLICTVVLGFYFAIILVTPLAYDNKIGLVDDADLNRMIFSLFWVVIFFDYLAIGNKVFHKNIKNKQEQIMLFSKTTRQNLFLSNLLFLLFYAFSRMLLLFIVVVICYAVKPRFQIADVLWLLFNVTINCLFVVILFVFICLSTFNYHDKQFLLFVILGAIFLWATMVITLVPGFIGTIFLYSSLWDYCSWMNY